MQTLRISTYFIIIFFTMLFASSCEKYSEDLGTLKNSTFGDVFIDGFTSGLVYSAFGNSVASAFQVDNSVTYNKSSSSMRVDVPRVNDPRGSFAGGSYYLTGGRNLSGYNVLTFWAKATKNATLNEVGFGNDFDKNVYMTALYNLPLTTEWQKYYIPIPDPSKLTNEKGMFYFSEGPENGESYSLWIDEVKFEKLGTVLQGESMIYDGKNLTSTAFKGSSSNVTNAFTSFNLPDGTTIQVPTPASYFNFESSNPTVASVSSVGIINALQPGYSVITASIGGKKSIGSMVINVEGFVNAPTPTIPSSSVVSLFSDNYTNVKVDYYNGYWAPYQKTTSSDFKVGTDNILNYLNFNFFGISFSNPIVNATSLSTLSMDIFVPGTTLNSGIQLKITVRDFGADGKDGGNDDTDKVMIFSNADLVAGQWKTLKIPLTMANKSKLGMIIFSDSDLGNLKNFYLDNIYFHN